MVAALSALNALAIDIMLPALPDIGRDFGLVNDNDRQLVIISYVALFGVSQLVYGPLADAYGRRMVLVIALVLFVAGTILSVVAPSFELFLAARCLQGIGAAATRVIATAVVRDLTSGPRMAQVMSMAMTVFLVVPILAPGIGQLILFIAPWRWIFGALLIYSGLVLAWTLMRLPETLTAENTTPFRPRAIAESYGRVFADRQTVGYMMATTFLTSCLFGYITSSEQLYVDTFNLGPLFPIAFASIALAMSGGTFLNAKLVIRRGMRNISHAMLLAFLLMGVAHLAYTLLFGAHFWSFIVLLALNFSVFGMIGANFNALAMEPMARNAGAASAMFGAVQASGGALLGGFIARGFDGTPMPFLIGVVLSALAGIATVLWTERGKLFGDRPVQR